MADNEAPEFKTFARVFSVVEIVIASFGAVLNIVTIVIILSIYGKLKTKMKLLLSLLVCDFMLSVLHIVLPLYYFDSVWVTDYLDYDVTVAQMEKYFAQSFGFHDFLKILCSDLYFTAQIVGLIIMLALAVDILILVKYPLQYESLTSNRRGNILLLSVWSGGVAFVLIFRVIVELDWFGVIDVTWSSYPLKDYVHYVYGAFQALSNICFLVFIVLYLVIYIEIRKLIARSPTAESRDTVKATVTMVLILVTYLIFMMPASWVVLAGVISGNSGLFRKLVVISRGFYVANSVCDPLLYAIRIPDVQQRYRSLFCKKDQQSTSRSATASTSVQ